MRTSSMVIDYFYMINIACGIDMFKILIILGHDDKPERTSKTFKVRPQKIRAALMWLKIHNPLYKNIEINFGPLEEEQSHIAQDINDMNEMNELLSVCDPVAISNLAPNEDKVIVPNDNKPSNNTYHIYKEQSSSHVIDIKHTPNLLSMIFPTLFPYGDGDYFQNREKK